MEWYEALALLLGAIVALMALGMPIALAFLAANIIGAWIFMGGERGVALLLNNGLGALTKFALMPIPLFLLMGEVFFHTGLGKRMFNAIDQLLGKLPGRLSYVTVLGRNGVLYPVGFLHGLHRASWLAYGAGDVSTRLQEEDVNRPDSGHRRFSHYHSAVGVGRTACYAGTNRRGCFAHCWRRPRPHSGRSLHHRDLLDDPHGPKRGACLRGAQVIGWRQARFGHDRRRADGRLDGGDRHADDHRLCHTLGSCSLWSFGCDTAVSGLSMLHLGGNEEVDPWRAAGHVDGLSDRLRFSDVLADLGFFRRLAGPNWLGNRVRFGSA
jgi:hypothetical protein